MSGKKREWKPLYLGVMAGGGAYAEDLAGALAAIEELRREADSLREELMKPREERAK